MEITREVAAKVLKIVDMGLSIGVGERKDGEQQGDMCVEAAVCYALGLPHGDDPGCVSAPLRSLKIRLNDSSWSSNGARGRGLRRLALAQLGSQGVLDDEEFVSRIIDYAICVSVPQALRSAASVVKDEKHKAALCEVANRCEKEGTREAVREAKSIATYADAAYAAADAAARAATYADAAYAAADAAAYAVYAAESAAWAAAYAADAAAAADARDKSLLDYAEHVVQILIEMKAPGCQWLNLTEVA